MRDDLFLKVLNQNKDPMFRYCVSITHNFHDAEDLVQEAFIKLYELEIDDETHAKNWLYKVCHNAGVLEYAVPMYRFHVYVEGVAIDGEELLVELFVPAL
ncbi:hypothetical protein AOC36_02990 [Erysipelothrix larvae]|uniref:RNA polymerase sigma-70 region 2 domain-containing protein n=1 Tax=Erysipelothrix larvae TaxID=1514105 RepID=A0A109UGN8_9FIRM|nr:sigma-70 family RNA polymerase sigma factor [Erysipelothrix larvae]AMC92983.1 hypothetical protein AOC36_02990 [Erysipelothrix larvae]